MEIVEKLRLDAEYLQKQEYEKISGECLNLPNRRTRTAKDLALALFPALPKTEAYIRYAYLVRDLKRHQVRLVQNLPAITPASCDSRFPLYKQARYDLTTYQELLKAPSQDPVLRPQAMPVQVSPLLELQDFFHVLDTGKAPEKKWADKNGEYEKFLRGAYYVDGRIDLCKQVVGDSGIQHLMNAIRRNPHIKHFLLGNNIIGETGGQCIGEWLQSEPHRIETWYLAGNDLNPAGIAPIAKALATDSACHSLWLKRNPLYPEGVAHIAKMLETNTTLRILDLNNVACFDKGLQYLAEALTKNRGLETLYLDANGISKTGISALAEYFRRRQQQPGLRNLFLGMNPIRDEGVAVLMPALRTYSFLERLTLNAGRIQLAGLVEIVEALETHPSLLYLDLGCYKATPDMGELPNCFGGGGGALLARLLKHNRTLRALDVSMCFLQDSDFQAIREVMPAQTTLCYFVAHRYGQKPSSVIHEIESYCAKNRAAQGWPASNRFFKHSTHVRWIDSIYRNRT